MQAGVKAGQVVIAVEACWHWLVCPSSDEPKLWQVGAVGSLDDLLWQIDHLGMRLTGKNYANATCRCVVLPGRLRTPAAI